MPSLETEGGKNQHATKILIIFLSELVVRYVLV